MRAMRCGRQSLSEGEHGSVTKKRSSCLVRALGVAGILAGVVIVLLLGLAINQRLALRRTRERYPAPGKLVDVSGQRMHIHCAGSGSPP